MIRLPRIGRSFLLVIGVQIQALGNKIQREVENIENISNAQNIHKKA